MKALCWRCSGAAGNPVRTVMCLIGVKSKLRVNTEAEARMNRVLIKTFEERRDGVRSALSVDDDAVGLRRCREGFGIAGLITDRGDAVDGVMGLHEDLDLKLRLHNAE